MVDPRKPSNVSKLKKKYSAIYDQLKEMKHVEHADKRKQGLVHKFVAICRDILGQHPELAQSEHIPDKMFALCFYPTILEDRKRKRKKKLNQEALDAFEKHLEGYINFYRGLVKFYLGLIDSEPTNSEGSNTNSISQGSKLTKETLSKADKPAVVKILYRFLISLGDLHRYKNESQEAIRSYEHAIFFSPGQGNPYNQMAVLEIKKDHICNALYYYARSIKASHEAFGITVGNLQSLYSQNLNWLKENYDSGKREGVENDSAFQNMLFCAQFVELHQRLQPLQPSTDSKNGEEYSQNISKLEIVIEGLEELLSKAAWGSDSLLCKMVAINAFTAGGRGTPSQSLAAQILAFRFGHALANRLELNLTKQLDTIESKNIRGLAPLLIACEHLLTFGSCDNEDFLSAEEAFWSKICIIANEINKVAGSTNLKEDSLEEKLPKEYEGYKGFIPFENFIPKPSKFITYEDAQDLAPKFRMKEADQEKKSIFIENRIKLARLLAILENNPDGITLSKDNCYIFKRDQGSVEQELTELSTPSLSDSEDDIISYRAPQHGAGPALLVPSALLVARNSPDKLDNNNALSSIITDDEKKLVDVRYQSYDKITLSGTENFQTTPVVEASPILFPEKNTTYDKPLPPPPPGINAQSGLKPPPGFASSTHNYIFSTPERGVLDLLANVPSTNPFTSNGSYDNYRSKEILESGGTQSSNFTKDQEVWDFLSNTPTKNPFTPDVTYKNYQGGNKVMEPDYANNYPFPKEQTSLLDSSLLQSLWGDDSKKSITTKNSCFNYSTQV